MLSATLEGNELSLIWPLLLPALQTWMKKENCPPAYLAGTHRAFFFFFLSFLFLFLQQAVCDIFTPSLLCGPQSGCLDKVLDLDTFQGTSFGQICHARLVSIIAIFAYHDLPRPLYALYTLLLTRDTVSAHFSLI